jgi:hypothetical protein
MQATRNRSPIITANGTPNKAKLGAEARYAGLDAFARRHTGQPA